MNPSLAIRSALVAFAIFGAVALMAGAASAAELFMFRRDGCPWCAKWDSEIGPIYPKTEFNARAPLRLVNLDHDPKPAIEHGPIRYTPTFVLVEAGKEIGRIEGYPGDEFFWFRLEGLLKRLPQPSPDGAPKGATAIAPKGVSMPIGERPIEERIL